MSQGNAMSLFQAFSLKTTIPDEGLNVLDDSQTWIPLEVFNLYRTSIAAILNLLFLLASIPEFSKYLGIVPTQVPFFLGFTLYSYLGFSLLCHFFTKIRFPQYWIQALLQILVDILTFTLLMQANKGLATGLSTLLVIVICAASVLLSSRLAFLCAAIATISVLLDQIFQQTFNGFSATNYPQAGALGLVFFSTATIINFFSKKLALNAQLVFDNQVAVRRLQRLSGHVVERIKIGALVVDEENRVTLANEAAIKLLKKDRVEVEQSELEALSPRLNEKVKLWKTQEKKFFHRFLLTEQGPVVVITMHSLGEVYGDSVLIFIEDLSSYLKESQEIKLAAMGRLTATIAHEIRNPLMAIYHSAQLLSESKYLKKEDRHLINIIEENTKRTNAVTENILLLSRAKPSTPAEIYLLDWLNNLLTDFKLPNDMPLNVDLKIPVEMKIVFDSDQLRQVLINLLENGARYSFQACGEAKLILKGEMKPQTEANAYLDVIDFGSGVSEELQSAIFEPFFTTDRKGNGLGLFVVKSLCELNKAQVSYHPDRLNRSCFRVVFLGEGNDISMNEGEK
jgi:two-component system sensor histidine kinase PilS (NtrC family)